MTNNNDPGPNQDDINKKQGIVNRKQGDLNDELIEDATTIRANRQRKIDDRQDEAEDKAAKTTELRDAEHIASEERQDEADALAVKQGDRREAQFDAQAETNLAQGVTNVDASARADASEASSAEEVVIQDEKNVASDLRQDVSEALSAKGVIDQDEKNIASDLRQDVSEALSATDTERREGQFDRQAETNIAQAQTNVDQVERNIRGEVRDERRTEQFDLQAQTNLEQAAANVINATAVAALIEVGSAAKEVTDLLRTNVARGRRWTTALACVVAVIIMIGIIGWMKFQTVTHDADNQRLALQVQQAKIEAQQKIIKKQADDFCEGSKVRSAANKKELTFLVDFAIGENNPDPKLRKFKEDYPAHLFRVSPPIVCAP